MFLGKAVRLSCFYLVFIAGNFLFSQTKVIPFQQLPGPSGTTNSGMYFGAHMTTSSITVTFEGPSDRWIALGFGTSMIFTDVLIYSVGHPLGWHPLGWQDYYNSIYSNSGVVQDANQDWNIISNTVAFGQRTVTASRSLNTSDPSDEVINFNSNLLNLVWAKGATADYTIAYHGSNNRANGISLSWISAPTASFALATTSVCAGSSLTYSNLTTGGSTSYSWTFGGGTPATSNSANPSVAYNASGSYPATLTVSNILGTDTYTQTNFVSFTPSVVPSINILQTSGSSTLCAGALATFSATIINGGISPSYSWKNNGVNTGANNSIFSTNSLINFSSITCDLFSTLVCATPSLVTSSPINITVNSTVAAAVSVAIGSGNNPICTGSPASFIATPINGGSAPGYTWQVNGSSVGANSSTFISNSLNNADNVHCLFQSNASCASSTFAISPAIIMSVSPVLVPQISILLPSSSGSIVCEGSPVTLSVTILNGGSSPSYQWLLNGFINGINASVYSPVLPFGDNSVNCILTSALSCANPTTVSSADITLLVTDCTGIQELRTNSDQISVFPNPSNGLFTISSANRIFAFKIYDSKGNIIRENEFRFNDKLVVDLMEEPVGIYLLDIKLEAGNVRKRLAKMD